VTFSLAGVLCSAYLFRGAHVLLARDASSGLDVALFAFAAGLLALIVLVSWFGAYCLLYRYARAIRRANGNVEIDMQNGKLDIPSECVRAVWKTGRIYVASVRGGVAFVFVRGGKQLFLCPRENIHGFER
jgi:hypothetical protein